MWGVAYATPRAAARILRAAVCMVAASDRSANLSPAQLLLLLPDHRGIVPPTQRTFPWLQPRAFS